MNVNDIIDKLRVIQEKRTHCQCSREMVVERMSFERVIQKLKALPDMEPEAVHRYLKAEADSIEPKNRDTEILKRAYIYAVEISRQMV